MISETHEDLNVEKSFLTRLIEHNTFSSVSNFFPNKKWMLSDYTCPLHPYYVSASKEVFVKTIQSTKGFVAGVRHVECAVDDNDIKAAFSTNSFECPVIL